MGAKNLYYLYYLYWVYYFFLLDITNLNYFNNLCKDLNAMGIKPQKRIEVFFFVWKKLKNFKKVFIPGKMASEYYC